MYGGHHAMWGMHWGWWLFWLLVIGVVIYLVIRFASRGAAGARSDNARQILERRYAAGEISTEEYQERIAALEGKHD